MTSIPTAIKDNLLQVESLNHRLAEELSNLPEIRDYKTQSSLFALEDLIQIYNFDPEQFDHLFEQMNRTGLAVHRKYCAPLQSFFWILQDEKIADTREMSGLDLEKSRLKYDDRYPFRAGQKIKEFSYAREMVYSLETILDVAWNGEATSRLTRSVYDVIHRIQTRDEKKEYAVLVTRHSDAQLQGYIMDDFLTNKEMFDFCDWEIIQTALDQSRWKLFYTVMDRLNSPELISYYINHSFFFRKTPSSGVYFTFRNKRAQCTDAAYFAQFLLARAGYKTFMRSIKWDSDPWDGLHTGAGIILDNGDYLLVANYTGINAISGPFSSLEKLDEKIACGRRIIDRRWGAYFPPRYY